MKRTKALRLMPSPREMPPINGPIDDPARTDPSVKFAARFRATGQFEFASMTV